MLFGQQDTILKNQFYAYPQFQKKYGIPNPNGRGFVIESKWQSALGSGTFAGMLVETLRTPYMRFL